MYLANPIVDWLFPSNAGLLGLEILCVSFHLFMNAVSLDRLHQCSKQCHEICDAFQRQ